MQPYHPYVFDTGSRRFVGDFEGMYRAEADRNFDSWYQEDTTRLYRRLARTVLEQYTFRRILDVGCGKGGFTHGLKTRNNHVVGIDLSPTAIERARAKYPDVDFRVLSTTELSSLRDEGFELVVLMEILSYVEDWRAVLYELAGWGCHVLVSLYLPPDPIGFVKSFDDLLADLASRFTVDTELRLRDGGSDHLLVVARSRR